MNNSKGHAVNSDYVEKIVITNSNVETDSAAFAYMDNLKEVDISNCKKVMLYDEFHDCPKLERVNITGQTVVVDYKAFHNCIALESVKITANGPNMEGTEFNLGVGQDLFYNNPSLKTIELSGNAMIVEGSLDGCSPSTEIIWNSQKYTVDQIRAYYVPYE